MKDTNTHNENGDKMKGSEKQIKYAQDLIEDYRTRQVEKFVKAGKADKIQGRIEVLEFVETLEDAGMVIEIMKNAGSFAKKDNPVHGDRGIKAYYNI